MMTCLTDDMCGSYSRYYLQTCDYKIAGYQYEPNPVRTCFRDIPNNDCTDCTSFMDCCAYTYIDCCRRVNTPIPTTMPSNFPTSMPSYFCKNESIYVNENTCGVFQVFRSDKILELDNGDMWCCADHEDDCCKQSYVIFVAIGSTLIVISLFFTLIYYMYNNPDRNNRRISPLNNIGP